jgi:SAM-dependent methyltransferase
MSTDVAREFWKRQVTYPFPFTRRRRIHELNYLVPRLQELGGKRLLDLGCGDGALLECLVHLVDYDEFFGFDVAEGLLKDINPRITTAIYDLAAPTALPAVDVTIMAGAIQYVFDDSAVSRVLEYVTSPRLYVRSTCTLLPEDEQVVTGGYASRYRTVPRTFELLSRHFLVTAVDRVYPDEIESKYGTKQFYFECARR